MVIALDIGTSSARAGLYDVAGRVVADRFHQVRYEPRVTADGGVEHDPVELLEAVAGCVDAVTEHARRDGEIVGVGVTTFWHGLLGFDAGGHPATPIYMWADSRAAREAAALRKTLDEAALHARTGCHLHSSYWPARLRWLAREQPAVVQRVARWGSFGEYLELQLFGETATTLSMASGTGLFDLRARRWDAEALAAAGVEPTRLFDVVDRTQARRRLRAPWAGRWPALRGVPWFPAIGDGAASNVGSDCVTPDRIALNVGTSAALRLVPGRPVLPPRGLWRYAVDGHMPLLGGATSEGGNVLVWCRSVLRLPDDDAALETALASRDPDAHGLTVLPFLAGERAPGWRGDKRAVIAGLSLHTEPLDIAQAALESVALRLATVYALLAPHAAAEHVIVASGGGVTRSRTWSRMLADALGRTIAWSHEAEATSRGAALLALDALGARALLGAASAPLDEQFVPDAERHARYVAARERQAALDLKV
jgi:gluconokinase